MSAHPTPVPDHDPDDLAPVTLRLVTDAASLLREHRPEPSDDAIERTVARVRREAGMTALLRTVSGSFARVARAAPELFGVVEPDDE